MIAFVAGITLLATAFPDRWKPRPRPSRTTVPQRNVSHPALYKVLGLGIAVTTLSLVIIVLFSLVMFLNANSRAHLYEGKPYHRSSFRVEQVYYHKSTGKSTTIDIFARGTVEGKREWMDLLPYLHALPHDQPELNDLVPAGTEIPIYLFPDLKGQTRVQIYRDTLPAENYRRAASRAVNAGLLGGAIAAGLLVILVRLRRACEGENKTPFAPQNATPISPAQESFTASP